MSVTLGGNVCIRNGNDLDYCWREAVASLLPVCDEVVVCDGESTDGTQEAIREWMTREPKIKLCVYPWPNPKGDNDFWVTWINWAKGHIHCDFHLELDADEVLSENSYAYIEAFKRKTSPEDHISLWCNRYNFWNDHRHTIPHGVCCGHRVARLAPVFLWMPSDGPHPRGAELISVAQDSPIEIFHYGFLRKREAWFKKARAIQSYFFNSYDERLVRSELYDGKWSEMHGISGWEDRLVPYNGPHPQIARAWLAERGYQL